MYTDIVWYRNPRFHVPPEITHLVDLYLRAMRGEATGVGIGAMGFLPDAGGIQDQAAVILDMMDIIGAAIRELSHALRP